MLVIDSQCCCCFGFKFRKIDAFICPQGSVQPESEGQAGQVADADQAGPGTHAASENEESTSLRVLESWIMLVFGCRGALVLKAESRSALHEHYVSLLRQCGCWRIVGEWWWTDSEWVSGTDFAFRQGTSNACRIQSGKTHTTTTHQVNCNLWGQDEDVGEQGEEELHGEPDGVVWSPRDVD